MFDMSGKAKWDAWDGKKGKKTCWIQNKLALSYRSYTQF